MNRIYLVHIETNNNNNQDKRSEQSLYRYIRTCFSNYIELITFIAESTTDKYITCLSCISHIEEQYKMYWILSGNSNTLTLASAP
ncbi:AMSH-like ubiquitin thioesterase 2 [Zea mays]|uniref:AMSH-like ubiquitin thioesterase 2 n=1 Tax=Zea mays TaxID=4577 RepID=A0A1D6G0W3_MAIZE|nr:AMSH-like ubiquitin thioesterase 2 [Zea mays]